MFKFKKDLESLDDRSSFANKICKMAFDKVDGQLISAVNFMEENGIFADLHEYVRNIYQFIGSEIPLMALAELIEHGHENWDFTLEEYQEAYKRTVDACYFYYKNRRPPKILDQSRHVI